MMNAPLDHTNATVRRTFIGASDVPIILGRSPYCTPLQLFEEKLGRRAHPPKNFAQHLGEAKEVEAREAYEMEYGVIANPAEIIHPSHPWLVVHPDGLYQRDGVSCLVEFKYLGRAAWAEVAASHTIPERHLDQVRCQLLVAKAVYGTAKLHYVAYDGRRLHVIEMWPEADDATAFLLSQLADFWQRIQRDDPPPFDPERDVEQREDPNWWYASSAYKQANQALREAETKVAEAKQLLLNLMTTSRRAQGNGVLVTKFERKGSIALEKVPELSAITNLDEYLDGFRAPPQTIVKVTVQREP